MSHLITQVGCYGVFPRINPQRPAEMVYMAVGGGAQVCQGGGGRSEGVGGVGVMGEGRTREDEGFLQDTERKVSANKLLYYKHHKYRNTCTNTHTAKQIISIQRK